MEDTLTPRPGHDRPLPQGLANRLAGWGSLARQYPIFGKTWFGYRMRSFALPMMLLAVILVFVAATTRGQNLSPLYGTLLAVWIVIALALVVGRVLAVLVCRQAWPARRESAGVVCALVVGFALALSLTPLTRIQDDGAALRKLNAQQLEQYREREREGHVANLAIWALALAWLGGGPDLLAWFRQRRMLRESELLDQVARYRDERNEVEMQLSLLASQVEPHFLFNTLSGVRAAMLSDPARGVEMIDHLVDYLRATIPQLRSDRAHLFVSLGSQLDAVQAYLGIIRARMPRLTFAVDCAPGLREAEMPPLMLISLVENAVKHGIERKKGPGLIRVTAARTVRDGAHLLALEVADDGMGFGASASGGGIGLANIRERLKHLYDGGATLSLGVADGGGVVARIALPLHLPTERPA